MINKPTSQEQRWQGEFGKEYTERNPLSPEDMDKRYFQNYGITRTELNKEFLAGLDPLIKILEVGANVGTQLALLQKMGFNKLFGIEINRQVIELSKSLFKNIDIISASALALPFKDGYFDLVFTAGVLIHISPSDVKQAMEEITRCTSGYVWGWEYYADEYTEVNYRGNTNMLWKANFSKLYLDTVGGLELVKEKKVKYLDNDNVDVMFLLQKKND